METTDNGPPRRRGPARLLWRFVAWFLENLYTNWAWGYDLVANITSMGQWWHWQEAVIPALPAGRCLELGFGTGRLMEKVIKDGREVYGLDRSPQMNRLTKARLQQAGREAKIVRADALQLPYASRSFHSVYATFPSDYLYKQEAMAEIWRTLTPGGKAIVIPFAVITGRSLWDRLARLLYLVTGQSPAQLETTWLSNITIPGFDLSYQRVEQERAHVLRVTLEKVPLET